MQLRLIMYSFSAMNLYTASRSHYQIDIQQESHFPVEENYVSNRLHHWWISVIYWWYVSSRISKSYHHGFRILSLSTHGHPLGQNSHSFWQHNLSAHDDVIKWKHFPRYWPFVREIHRWPVISLHKGQWRGALMCTLICAWINGWINSRYAGDLRRHRNHYDVDVLTSLELHRRAGGDAPLPMIQS